MNAPNHTATPGQQLAAQQRMSEHAMHNVAAERIFLASLFRRPELIDDARATVPPDYLFVDLNSEAYKLMLDHAAYARANNWPLAFDVPTLATAAQHLQRTKLLDSLEFWEHLRSILLLPINSIDATWPQVVHSVKQVAAKVRTYRAVNHAARRLLDGHLPEQVQAQLLTTITSLSSECGQQDIRVLGDGPLVSQHGGGIRPSFLPWTMSQLGGFCPQTLTMLVARTGAGKSSFLMAIALDVALGQGIPVLLMDDEMTDEQLRRRAVSSRAQINDDLIREGKYTHDPVQVAAVQKAAAEINNPNLLLASIEGKSHDERIALIEKFHRQFVLTHPQRRGLVLFDYLKLPTDTGRANEWTILGQMADQLKQTAKRLHLPIVAAVQANRIALGAEQSDVLEKGLAFISGSDRIAHVADAALLLRNLSQGEQDRVREKFGVRTNIPEPTSPHNLLSFSQVLHPLKNRNGDTVTGGTPLFFHRGQVRYSELACKTGTNAPTEEYQYIHTPAFMRKSKVVTKFVMPPQQPMQS